DRWLRRGPAPARLRGPGVLDASLDRRHRAVLRPRGDRALPVPDPSGRALATGSPLRDVPSDARAALARAGIAPTTAPPRVAIVDLAARPPPRSGAACDAPRVD